MGRKTTEYSGSTTGPKLASCVFDTIQAGKLSCSTRYTPSGNYLVGVSSYDGAGNPGNYILQVPSSVAGLAGICSTAYGNTSSGQLISVHPASGGGLSSETIDITYDSLGNAASAMGYNAYVSAATYTAYGEAAQYTVGTSTNTAWLTSVMPKPPHHRRQLLWAVGELAD